MAGVATIFHHKQQDNGIIYVKITDTIKPVVHNALSILYASLDSALRSIRGRTR